MRSDFVGDRNWVSSAPTAKVDVVLPDVISKYLATGDASALQSALTDLLTLDGARESLMTYFENFLDSDAFLEIRDLETYAATGENLQLYLYLGVLKYGSLTTTHHKNSCVPELVLSD